MINAIAGLNPPTSGKVKLFDEDVTGMTPERLCRRGMARTFQIPRPFPKLSVRENVLIASTFGNRRGVIKDHISHSRAMLEFVEFPKSEETISESLNTVQLKRLDLARALASSPRVLFLDELAAGLTEGEISDIIRIIRKIKAKGITILMVEHIMQLIMSLCSRLVVLQFGNKLAEGPTQDVARDPRVAEAYLGRGHAEKTCL